jgi:16S rRNA G966 N2-methylase RsmD
VNDQRVLYNRELLLLGAKRNAVLELWEVQRYGSDSFSDRDYVSIYGMRPVDWYAKGIRLLGRTAVECTRDRLAGSIGKDVAAIAAAQLSTTGALIIDPFAGSANTLYWLLRHLPGARAVGFESDTGVFQLTRQNIAALALPIDILNTDYVSGLGEISAEPDELLITFIAPPWGNAFDKTSGLDLRRTTPPLTEIVDFLFQRFSQNPQLCVIQVYEIVVPKSISELRARFDWSALRIYEVNKLGENHGILLGTKGWAP